MLSLPRWHHHFFKSVEYHLSYLDEVFYALGQAGISLKLKKCSFFTDTVKDLDHRILPGTLEIELAVSKILSQLRPPRTPMKFRSFLWLWNVYFRFIRDHTTTERPLYDFLKRNLPKQLGAFTEEQNTAFKSLLGKLSKHLILALFQPNILY